MTTAGQVRIKTHRKNSLLKVNVVMFSLWVHFDETVQHPDWITVMSRTCVFGITACINRQRPHPAQTFSHDVSSHQMSV